MRPTVTDQAVWSVTLSVTLVSPAKTAEPIEMPSGLRTRVGTRSTSPVTMGNFDVYLSCAKLA